MRDAKAIDSHYTAFQMQRDERAKLLKKDERFLTPEDRIQPGDVYMGNPPDWWPFQARHHGGELPPELFCYTPKGKKERK